MSDFKANDEADTVSLNAEANLHSFIHRSLTSSLSVCHRSKRNRVRFQSSLKSFSLQIFFSEALYVAKDTGLLLSFFLPFNLLGITLLLRSSSSFFLWNLKASFKHNLLASPAFFPSILFYHVYTNHNLDEFSCLSVLCEQTNVARGWKGQAYVRKVRYKRYIHF